MANYEATKYDYSGANLTGIEGVNTGLIIPWGSTSIPSGFLECDGSAVSRSTYANLFAVVGTTFGAGDGSTTFNLPDLQDRCCEHGSAPNFAGGVNTNDVTFSGNVGGSASPHTLTTPELPSHAHPSASGGPAPGTGGDSESISNTNAYFSGPTNTSNTGGGGAHTHNLSANFTGDTGSNIQPTLALLYIIKT